MAETEYVIDGKVQAGIFPSEGCVYTNPSEINLQASLGMRLRYPQDDFKAGKGVKNPCWNCLYNKSLSDGICKVSRVGFRENGKEFLIFPKTNDVDVT
ncbi:MAG: hypothetical protein KKB25_02075 [Nanoarchaeota archaeon]|nr:hypothetical protein [Nanoarchaeota archaeon]